MGRDTAEMHDFGDNVIVFPKLQEMPEEAVVKMKKRVRKKLHRSLHSVMLATSQRRNRAQLARARPKAA